MTLQPFSIATIRLALASGWRSAHATRAVSIGYASVFVLFGAVIIGFLLSRGWTPFVIAAAGAFMLIGPAILAGFFGVADALDGGRPVTPAAVVAGFARAAPALWALALVCGLLFMIFVTDAAILYAYMVGAEPVWLAGLLPAAAGVQRFVLWSAVSGAVVAVLLFCISAFAVPLLSERRCGLVDAVATSVRVVRASPGAALVWACLLAAVIMASILVLPFLALTLPWLAYASRALYRAVLPV